MNVDILIAVAEKGGVENVIKLMIGTLESPDMHFRVVQMVWEGYRWLDETIEFYPLLEGRAGHGPQEFIQSYHDFLQSSGETPDVILAAGWPYLCTVAGTVKENLRLDTKIISWVHSEVAKYAAAGYGDWQQLADADAHFAINSLIYHQFLQKFSSKTVFEIHNPVVFPEKGQKCEDTSLTYQLLYIGRLSAEKNLSVVFRALQKEKKWTLHIVGEGSEMPALKRLSDELNINNQLVWHGWQDDPWKYLENMQYQDKRVENFDALILSSLYEGLPLVVIEAQARGLPVISTDVGGLSFYIKNGGNGYLYPSGDDGALTDILSRIEQQGYVLESNSVCVEVAKPYEKNRVFQDMKEKILAIVGKTGMDKELKKKISVIIPCYNAEEYISRCLDSVYSQKSDSVEIEVICIDDASEDNTLSILRKYEGQYPEKTILIPLQENRKQGYARNLGMTYATGDYIFFMDSDDFMAGDFLETLYEHVRDASFDMIVGGFQKVLTDDSPEAVICTGSSVISGKDSFEKKKYIIEKGCDTAPFAKLYLKKFLDDYNIRFAENCYMEDIYFSELCMLYAKEILRVFYNGYFYVIHHNSVMFSDNIIYYYMDTPKVQNMVADVALQNGLLYGIYEEFMVIHFVKSFVEPINRMRADKRFFSYPNIRKLKRDLLRFFPDILQNSYIKNDKACRFYLDILEYNYDMRSIKELFYGE